MTIPQKQIPLSQDALGRISRRAGLNDMASLFSLGREMETPHDKSDLDKMRKQRFQPAFAQTALRKLKSGWRSLNFLGAKGSFAAIEFLLSKKLKNGPLERTSTAPVRLTPGATYGVCGLAEDLSTASMIEGYGEGRHLADLLGEPVWWEQETYARAAARRLAARATPQSQRLEFACDVHFDSILCAVAPLLSMRLKWAFARLHDAGFAHCFEAFDAAGKKMGAGFGVAIGDYYFIDCIRLETGCAAQDFFAALGRALEAYGVNWVVAQCDEAMLTDAGFAAIARSEYRTQLQYAWPKERIGKWRIEIERKLAA